MTHAQTNTNGAQPPKKKRRCSSFKMGLIILALVLALLILKIVLIIIAVPTISVDYLAEYSELIKPANYDPTENAASYYEKSFDYLVDMPRVIASLCKVWPTDMNDTEFDMIKAWLALNSRALAHLRSAVDKRYYWVARHSAWFGRGMVNANFPERMKFRTIASCLDFETKISLREGKTENAFENVVSLYKMAGHLCAAGPLIEQLMGMRLKTKAREFAFVILESGPLDPGTLKQMQLRLEHQISASTAGVDFRSEKYLAYDIIQRVFTDNGQGSGFLIPRTAGELLEPMIIGLISPTENSVEKCFRRRYLRFLSVAIAGPSRAETVAGVDKYFAYIETLKSQTLWKLHAEGLDSDGAIRNFVEKWFVRQLVPSVFVAIESHQRQTAEESALLATITILRYNADKSRFPQTLEQLIESGYLKELPMDPYRDGPLVYKRVDDDFTLYSVGADFDDDGGVGSEWGEGRQGGDMVFWPVKRPGEKQE